MREDMAGGRYEVEGSASPQHLALFLAAFLILLVALVAATTGFNALARRLTILSLAVVNVAGYLGGRYGVEGAGVVATLIVTAPFIGILVQRDFAAAANRQGAASERAAQQ